MHQGLFCKGKDAPLWARMVVMCVIVLVIGIAAPSVSGQVPVEITLTKTVGTDPDVCSATDSIVVVAGTTVYYCYTVQNIGDATASFHSLEDDQLGPIFSDFLLDLPPGGIVSITAASVVAANVINTATWCVRNSPTAPFFLDCAVDTASVVVTTPPTETPTATPTSVVTGPSPTPTATEVPPTETPTETPTEVPPTETPTETPILECDGGYYILDSLGGRHKVGNIIDIVGPVYFFEDLARDFEKANCNIGPASDLAVLDGLGFVHFVANGACNIPFPDDYPINSTGFSQGRAVDVQITADSAGFWVLTDYGEIFRGGSAGTTALGVGQNGVLGFDIPTPRDPGTANLTPTGTSLRAVSFVAIDEDGNSQADGYVVLDSMGGRFYYESDGSEVVGGSRVGEPANDPEHLLDPSSYVWPFFPGLDIARDIELHPTQTGVVILDGWDGIHPVPVNDINNPVWFARNEDPLNPGQPASTTGMPYIVTGFDDPSTGPNEGDGDAFGIDAESIFNDLEFAVECEGLYTLTKHGAVFVMGEARPVDTEPVPNFGNSPYFFPFLYAEAIEIFGPAPETF